MLSRCSPPLSPTLTALFSANDKSLSLSQCTSSSSSSSSQQRHCVSVWVCCDAIAPLHCCLSVCLSHTAAAAAAKGRQLDKFCQLPPKGHRSSGQGAAWTTEREGPPAATAQKAHVSVQRFARNQRRKRARRGGVRKGTPGNESTEMAAPGSAELAATWECYR